MGKTVSLKVVALIKHLNRLVQFFHFCIMSQLY